MRKLVAAAIVATASLGSINGTVANAAADLQSQCELFADLHRQVQWGWEDVTGVDTDATEAEHEYRHLTIREYILVFTQIVDVRYRAGWRALAGGEVNTSCWT